MEPGFGARLRKHREARKITVEAIAEQTKIKRSLLEALERDDLSHWPSGIFRRSWVRSYATTIGLDGDLTVREFLECHPDPEDIPPVDVREAPPPEPPGLRGLVDSALERFSRRMRRQEARPERPAQTAAGPAATGPTANDCDLPALARLCTRFGQANSPKDVQPLLQEAAGILDATGLIVWLWQSTTSVLRPALVHGYSAGVVARLPPVNRDADNPTAASFRTGQARQIDGGANECGALVVPLLLRARCVGVLAIELQPGARLSDSAKAMATIIAAALAQLVSRSHPAEGRPSKTPRRASLSPVSGTA